MPQKKTPKKKYQARYFIYVQYEKRNGFTVSIWLFRKKQLIHKNTIKNN